ncbi:MAG: biotin/lipoyl-containing protein, partial [Ornithinimicrobium sp.]
MPLFPLPDPGEGLVEAEIVAWKVKKGDAVKTNDVVVEVETAKSLVELPIPYDGIVRALLVAEGDVVEVGKAIIDIDDGSGDRADGSKTERAASDGVKDGEADVQQPPRPDDLVPQVGEEPAPATTPAPEAAQAPTREANLVGYGPSAGATTR